MDTLTVCWADRQRFLQKCDSIKSSGGLTAKESEGVSVNTIPSLCGWTFHLLWMYTGNVIYSWGILFHSHPSQVFHLSPLPHYQRNITLVCRFITKPLGNASQKHPLLVPTTESYMPSFSLKVSVLWVFVHCSKKWGSLSTYIRTLFHHSLFPSPAFSSLSSQPGVLLLGVSSAFKYF